MSLSTDQIETYWKEGYVLVEGLIPQTDLDLFSSRFEAIIGGDVEVSPMMKIMKDVMVVKRAVEKDNPVDEVNKLFSLENDPVFFNYLSHPNLCSSLQGLLGKTLYSLASNVFNKPSGVDGKHPMHQDLRYFRLRPADEIVGVWTSIGGANRESGCLSVLPGSHRLGIQEHTLPEWEFVNHGFYGIESLDREQRVHVEMNSGDTIFFHPLLVHGSGSNRSGVCRRAISAHYASDNCVSEKSDWRELGLTRKII
mgnify:CR=1 FL=1